VKNTGRVSITKEAEGEGIVLLLSLILLVIHLFIGTIQVKKINLNTQDTILLNKTIEVISSLNPDTTIQEGVKSLLQLFLNKKNTTKLNNEVPQNSPRQQGPESRTTDTSPRKSLQRKNQERSSLFKRRRIPIE
jgi:hypothetical protein